jgi:hypothetical protein
MTDEQIRQTQSDTVSILLTNRIHQDLADKPRSIKISKCCKKIRAKTKDAFLSNICKDIISANHSGNYSKVVGAINLTEFHYFDEYLK